MRRSLIIYLPSVLLLILAIALPQMGRNLVGKMNGREFALFLAFWWTILAAGYHLVKWTVSVMRRSTDARGFDVLPKK